MLMLARGVWRVGDEDDQVGRVWSVGDDDGWGRWQGSICEKWCEAGAGSDEGMVGRSVSQGSRIGQTGAQATSWTSDTLVVCKAAAGVGRSLLVAMTAGAVSGSMSGGASYDTSSASSLALVNEGTTGGGSVTVAGADFGTSRCAACGILH